MSFPALARLAHRLARYLRALVAVWAVFGALTAAAIAAEAQNHSAGSASEARAAAARALVIRHLLLRRAEALIEAEPGAVAHMNGDHADALELYATRLLDAPAGAWRCTGCDPEGLDLRLDRVGLRLAFPQRVNASGPLRAVLVQLAQEARAK